VISRIRGVLLRRGAESIEVMTAGGVAYELVVPLGVHERLPAEGAELELRTWQVIREDAHELFGFLEEGERALFARLLTASGVGPRLALSMLSTLQPDRLVRAIAERDIASLRRIPGLGAKKAEKLAVELADRLGDLAVIVVGPQPRGRAADEAVGALVALGYPPALAGSAVRQALDGNAQLAGSDLIKAALATVAEGR
jgi:holliday junction DNA helicase RuvA